MTHKNFYIVEHPLVQHKLTLLRDKKTVQKEFKELVTEITLLLAYEATKNLPLTTKTIATPMETCEAKILADEKYVILPILRAGIGMVDSFLTLLPTAKVAHIGLFRDEQTLEPQYYYFKIPPDSKERQFFVCDPMLATGGSAVEAVNRLKQKNVHKIIFVCIVAAPEGVQKFSKAHPEIPVYTAALDRQLNEKGYILPGLGDAGDRMFGT
jgi:uracil phosphoribosyltransferase